MRAEEAKEKSEEKEINSKRAGEWK